MNLSQNAICPASWYVCSKYKSITEGGEDIKCIQVLKLYKLGFLGGYTC